MKKIKIIALLLIIFLAFTACSSGNTNSGADNNNKPVQESSGEITVAIERPNIPDGTNYNGYEFKVLIPDSYINGKPCEEVSVEQETGEPLNDAVYKETKQSKTYWIYR